MYNLAIIGAGPAGLSASVYASRYGLKNIIIGEPGGLAAKSHEIGNWLGTPKISGAEFSVRAEEHAKSLGAQIEYAFVDTIEKNKKSFLLKLNNKKEIKAETLLLAMGTAHRQLNIPGEKKFLGKGVSYCATCDGYFYKNKAVAVVGGSDSAAEGAIFLADLAEKVYLIYRGDKLRAEKFWLEAIKNNPKIEIIINTSVKEIKGDDKVGEIALDNAYKNSETLKVDGVFIEIGLDPNIELAKNLSLLVDPENHIIIDSAGRTNIPGIWAAGDITNGSNKFKQIVTAAAEGAIAARSIEEYLKSSI
jgi:thioredoxin reductase (NADPH)